MAPDGDRFIFLKLSTAGQTGNDAPFNGLIVVQHWFEELRRLVPTD